MRLVAEEGSALSPPRWRGAAYDLYMDGRWEQSFSGMVLLPRRERGTFLLDRPSDAYRVANEVFLEPLDTDVLFLPPASLEISVRLRSVFVDPYLTTHTGRPALAGRRYTVRWRPDASLRSSSVGGVEQMSDCDRSRYLQMPRLSEEFHEMARRAAAGRPAYGGAARGRSRAPRHRTPRGHRRALRRRPLARQLRYVPRHPARALTHRRRGSAAFGCRRK